MGRLVDKRDGTDYFNSVAIFGCRGLMRKMFNQLFLTIDDYYARDSKVAKHNLYANKNSHSKRILAIFFAIIFIIASMLSGILHGFEKHDDFQHEHQQTMKIAQSSKIDHAQEPVNQIPEPMHNAFHAMGSCVILQSEVIDVAANFVLLAMLKIVNSQQLKSLPPDSIHRPPK